LLGATVFIASAVITQPGTDWNSNSRLGLVFAVVDQGELTIDDYHDTPPYSTQDKAEYQGHYYSDKVIGLTLLAVPAYAAIRAVEVVTGTSGSFQLRQYLLTRWSVALPAAAAAMLMASLLITLGGRARRAILVTAGVFFGSMLFGQTTVMYPYVPGIALCLGALLVVLSRPLTSARSAAAGGLLGLALIFDFTFGITVAIVSLLAIAELRGRPTGEVSRLIGVAIATAAVPLAVFAAYSTRIFGSPTIPYRYESLDYFREGMQRGLMGATAPKPAVMWFLSVHPFRGVLFWSPWLVMAVVSAVRLMPVGGRLRRVGLASLAALVGYFLFNAGYFLWWGGGGVWPRLMSPMFALVPLALVTCCRDDSPRWMTRSLAVTMVTAVALCLPLSMSSAQTEQPNSTELLSGARIGTSLRVPQLGILHSFYTLDWAGLKTSWGLPVGVGFVLCTLVVLGGTALAARVAGDETPGLHEPGGS